VSGVRAGTKAMKTGVQTRGGRARPTPRRNNFAREFCETKRYEIFRSRNFRGPFFVSCVLVDDFARFVCSSAHLTPHTSTTTCPLSLPAIAGLRGAVVVEDQCRPGRATQWCVLQPAGFLPCTPCKPSRASQHYDPKKHANRMCAWEGGRAGARAQGGVGATGLAKEKKKGGRWQLPPRCWRSPKAPPRAKPCSQHH
jgi:hypothetical protein